MTDLENQVIALAGACQAAVLVQSIARTGEFDKVASEASISSILVVNADSVEHVFGGVHNLALGLNTLKTQLSDASGHRSAELTRYLISIMAIERKISAKSALTNTLGERIEHVQRQVDYFDYDHTQITEALASIYSDVVSPNAPKMKIIGSQEYLTSPLNQFRVRAHLLAGIRATVLWRQVGGSRWKLLFNRNQIITTARRLVSSSTH